MHSTRPRAFKRGVGGPRLKIATTDAGVPKRRKEARERVEPLQNGESMDTPLWFLGRQCAWRLESTDVETLYRAPVRVLHAQPCATTILSERSPARLVVAFF